MRRLVSEDTVSTDVPRFCVRIHSIMTDGTGTATTDERSDRENKSRCCYPFEFIDVYDYKRCRAAGACQQGKHNNAKSSLELATLMANIWRNTGKSMATDTNHCNGIRNVLKHALHNQTHSKTQSTIIASARHHHRTSFSNSLQQ